MKTVIISIILILTQSLIAQKTDSKFTAEEIEEFKKMEALEKKKKNNSEEIEYFEKMEALEKEQDKQELNYYKNDKIKYQPKFNVSKGLREENNFGINASFGGSPIVGLSLDYFVTENFNIEVSFVAGIYPVVIGMKYYFTPKKNFSAYLGIHTFIGIVNYLPIGIEYMFNNGFTISVEAGPLVMPELNIYHDDDDDDDDDELMVIPWGGVKVGYHF